MIDCLHEKVTNFLRWIEDEKIDVSVISTELDALVNSDPMLMAQTIWLWLKDFGEEFENGDHLKRIDRHIVKHGHRITAEQRDRIGKYLYCFYTLTRSIFQQE